MKRRHSKFLALLLAVSTTVTSYGPYPVLAAEQVPAIVSDVSDSEAADMVGTSDGAETPQSDVSENDGSASDVSVSDVSQNGEVTVPALDQGTYPVDESVTFQVTSNEVTAKSYSADVKVKVKGDNGNFTYLYLIYTQAPASGEALDFFSEKTKVTSSELSQATEASYQVSGGQWFYSYDNSEYSQTLSVDLTANTTYTYRVAAYSYNDYNNYYFLTEPATFTTKAPVEKTAVEIGDVTILNYGYGAESISVEIKNPNNEQLVNGVEVYEDGKSYAMTALYDERNTGKYTGTVETYSGKALEVRVGVRTGAEGTIGYVSKEIPVKQQDVSKRKVDVNAEGKGMMLRANATLQPSYAVDDYSTGGIRLYLYYRTNGENYYQSNSSYFSTPGGEAEPKTGTASTSTSLNPEQTYEYYAVVTDGNGEILANAGSAEAPMTYTTGKLVTYTEADFKDKNLYAALQENSYGRELTNVYLESLTDFSYYHMPTSGPITSLEDVPEKLPNLTYITLEGQNISDISPLTKLPDLKSVYLNYNDIASLPDLSGVQWTQLSLNYNFLKPEDIDGTKLPADLQASGIVYNYRSNEFTLLDTYYVDNNGNFPLIVDYKGTKDSKRTYALTVSIGDVTKEFTDARMDSYSRTFFLQDLNTAMGVTLEQDKTYEVKVSIADQFGVLKEETKQITFAAAVEQVQDYYMSSADTYKYVNLYFPGSYAADAFTAVYAVKDGKKFMVSSSINGNEAYTSYGMSVLYGSNTFYDSYDVGRKLSYTFTNIGTGLNANRIMTAGDYDLVLERKEGDPIAFAGKLHVMASPVVTAVSASRYSDYDYNGDYYYIRLGGYYLSEDKVYPVITDADGTEYTTLVEMIQTYSDTYYYKLKKKDNWTAIESGSPAVYYIKLVTKGEVLDKTTAEEKTVSVSQLQNSKYALSLKTEYYNWKKETLELVFGSAMAPDTLVEVKIREEDYEGPVVASGSAKTDANGRVSIVPKDAQGATYILRDEQQYYLDIFAGDESTSTSFWVNWYNVSSFYVSTSGYYEAGIDTLNINVYGHPSQHETDQIYVKLFDAQEQVIATSEVLTYKKESDARDRFYNDAWKLGQQLAAGNYTLRAYEKVNNVEVERTSYAATIYVVEKTDVFYMASQSFTYDMSDSTSGSLYTYLPYIEMEATTDASKLADIVKKYKLEVQVFDAEGNAVKAKVTPYRSYTSGAFYFTVSGLDKDMLGYYFKVTSDGKPGIDPRSGKTYYSDETYGAWASRSSSISSSYYTDRMAYTYIYTRSAFADDAPYTVKFYSMADRGTCIHSFKLAASQFDKNGYYYLKPADVAKLDKNEVYHCIIISNRGYVSTSTGYFEANSAEETKPVAVKSVSITGSGKKLSIGETMQLTAVITPSDATDQSVTWSSSKPEVATVDAKGLVTAVAYGNTVITVTTTDGGKTATYALQVINPEDAKVSVNSVVIQGNRGSMTVGGTMQLTAVVSPSNANDKSVVWTSSDEAVIKVDAQGLLTAVAVGRATITVTTNDGAKTASCDVFVTETDNGLYVEFDEGAEFFYTGAKITPAVSVYYHGEELIENVDYTVKYANNLNASEGKPTKSLPKVTVTGKTVAASAEKNFVIHQKDIADEDVTAGAIVVVKGAKAVPVLCMGGYKLGKKDFKNPDEAKKFSEVGFDTIIVEGQGNFTGKRSIDVEVVSDKKALKKMKVVFKAAKRTYNGEEQLLTSEELTVADASDKHVLTENVDYIVAYPADITSAGKVKISVVGIGSYSGTVNKTYTIAPLKDNSGFNATDIAPVTYVVSGATPVPEVSYKGEVLELNKDYKVSYSGNKKAGNGAKCTITFQGNYKGSAKLVKTFTIKPASLENATVDGADKAFTKAGKYLSAPYVSIDGIALGKKDYDVTYTTASGKDPSKDKIEESDLTDGVLVVNMTVTGKGNYDASVPVSGSYRIVKADAAYDLSKAKVEIRNKSTQKKVTSFAFTGEEITIGEENELYVTIGKEKTQLKEGVDFTVTYVNNVNKGKATIILTGLGDESNESQKYYGSKTATFSIGKGIFRWF